MLEVIEIVTKNQIMPKEISRCFLYNIIPKINREQIIRNEKKVGYSNRVFEIGKS
jgi:hypothetical protein